MNKSVVFYFSKEYTPENPYKNLKAGVEEKHTALFSTFPCNIKIYIAQSISSYVRKNTFIPQFQRTTLGWKKYSGSPITADLVLGFDMPDEVTHIFPSIKELTKNKTIFEKIFPQYAIASIVCNSYEDISSNFGNIATKLKVLKPLTGTRSKGIIIRESLPSKEQIGEQFFPYILQEFFDTSGGFFEYPGLHDFRVVMLDGKIVGKFLRQPEPGLYTANSFHRGNFIDLRAYSLPPEVTNIIDEIESYCKEKYEHRYYSIDLGIGRKGEVKVFEMNSAPGLTDIELAKTLGEYIVKKLLKV